MIRYMGHGLKLPRLACMRYPALPASPFLGGIVALVYPYGWPYTQCTRCCMRLKGLFVKVQGCLPERLCLSLLSPYLCLLSAHIPATFIKSPAALKLQGSFYGSKNLRPATMASISCSLGPDGSSGGCPSPVGTTTLPLRNSSTEAFTMPLTVSSSCSLV